VTKIKTETSCKDCGIENPKVSWVYNPNCIQIQVKKRRGQEESTCQLNTSDLQPEYSCKGQ
jgi:hypothetical protein